MAEKMGKLTEEDVIEIRELHASGKWNQRELADIFGVSKPHISNIIRGKKWHRV